MKKSKEQLIHVLKALGDPNRMRIFKLLTNTPKMCAGVVADKLSITQPAVSQHLKILKNAGLLKSEKIGLYVHYRIDEKEVNDFKTEISNLLEIEYKNECKTCPKSVNK